MYILTSNIVEYNKYYINNQLCINSLLNFHQNDLIFSLR